MKSWFSHVCAIMACVLAIAMTMPARVAGQTSGMSERFTAFAVNMGNFGPTQSGTVEIVVTRWSTDDEREMLIGALLDKDPTRCSMNSVRRDAWDTSERPTASAMICILPRASPPKTAAESFS